MSKSSITAVALVLVMVASAFAVASVNVSANKGTRDSFGYAWTDSKSPSPSVAFNWVEIRPTGTLTGVSGDDSWGGPYSIGFDFDYYGNRYTAFNVTTNGYIMFGTSSTDYTDESIPSSGSPNNIIAIYWHDMYMGSSPEHGIYYETVGSAPDRQLVVEFNNMTDLSGSSHMTMEIILCENGEIWMQYRYLNGYYGGDAEVGIENSGGTVGCEYSDDTPSLEDNLAIRYSVSPVVIGPSSTLRGPPSSTLTYDLTVTNKLAVSDSIAIRATSVEGWPMAVYDSSWNPLVDHDFDGWVDTGTLSSGASYSLHVNVTIPASPANSVEYIAVNASAHSNSLLYDVCVLTAEEADAWFLPPHSSYATDEDLDGDYDTLTLNVSFYCRVAGSYYIYGYLYTNSGFSIGSQGAWSTVATGSQTVQLVWNGWPIREASDDGQLHVNLELYDNSWNLLDEDVHYTAYYAATDFMMRPGVLTSPHSDSGLDIDSDGLYEQLVLHAGITANYDGQFRLTVNLYDSSWSWMLTESVVVDVAAGGHVVNVSFDSKEMRHCLPAEGPYNFNINLYAYVRGSWVSVDSDNYQTGWYDVADFEAPDAFFQGPHDDSVANTDGDSYYEWLYLDVGVNVTVPGNYSVRGELSIWYTYIDTVTNTTYLSAGNQVVRLAFPGYPIRLNGDSDEVDIDLTLTGDSGQLDTDSFTSSTYYYYYNFDTAPGWFVSPYEYSVYDSNADGLFDYFLVNVTVNVTMAGFYEVHVDLEDWWYDTMCDSSNRTYLSVGEHTFHFALPGWMIRNWGDDPYRVYMYLYDEDGRQLDTDYFSASAYAYTSFQGTPASIGSSGNTLYPRDDDADGLNETMVQEVNVTVTSAGVFVIEGILYDGNSQLVGHERTVVSLAAGYHTVSIEYPGWMIHALAVNGTYWCYTYLHDADMNDMDSWSFSGGYWVNVFDGTVPSILSAWTTSAPSINGAMGSAEWAGAALVDLGTVDSMNMVGGDLLVMNDETTLYLCFDVYGDTTDDDYDASAFAFDTGNDEVTTDSDEDEFYSYANGGKYHYAYDSVGWWQYDCGFDDTLIDHSGLAGVAGFANTPSYAYNHRVFEYAIPLSLIGATMWDTLGFMTATHQMDGLHDDTDGLYSAWPLMASNHVLEIYGDLVLSSNSTPPPPVTTHSLDGTIGGGSWYISPVNITLSASGGSGGVDHTEYSLDGGFWQTYTGTITVPNSGMHTLRYRSEDAAHHMEGIRAASFNIDRTPPVTVPGRSGTTVWLNSSDADSGISSRTYRVDGGSWTSYSGSFSAGNPAVSHTVEFYASDVAGNVESTQILTILPAAPVTTITLEGIVGDNGWYTSAVNVTLSASGGSGGVDYTEYRLDAGSWTNYVGMIVVQANGTHSISYRSVDMGGQVEGTQSSNFMIDAVAPSTAVGRSGVMLWLNSTDANSGVLRTMYRLDGGTWTNYLGSFSMGLGSHVLEYYAVDYAGNSESVKTMSMVGPPVTTIVLAGTLGSSGWYITSVTFTLSATGGSGGVDHTEYSLNGGAWQNYSEPVIVQTGGTHTLRYMSTDNADQVEGMKTATLKVDMAAPTTQAAKSGQYFWLNSTDPHSGVSSVVYRIDGGEWTLYVGRVNVTVEGKHTIEFHATDVAGNAEEVQSITVKVGGKSGIAALLVNPILWLVIVAAIVAVVLLMFVMKRRRGQQPMMYPQQYQQMPQQGDFPPPPPTG